MRSILYIIAVICLIAWIIGLFVFSAVGTIDFLIVLAIIAFLIGILKRSEV